MIYSDLVLNLTLLISLSIVSGFIEKSWPRQSRTGLFLQGALFGTVTVFGMLKPLNLGPGLIFDGRSMMISLCALFFGPLAGAVAVTMAILCRLGIGGAGTTAGTLVTVSSLAIGIVGRNLRKPDMQPPSSGFLYSFGILVHLVMLMLMLTLPDGAGPAVVAEIGLPVLLLYPLATVLAGKLLADQVSATRMMADLQQTSGNLAITMQAIGDAVLSTNEMGEIVLMNPVAEALTGWSHREAAGRKVNEIFRIVNEVEHKEIDSTAVRVLREGLAGDSSDQNLLIARDGSIRPVSESCTPIRNAEGTITGVVLVFRDQSEERRLHRVTKARFALIDFSDTHSLSELLTRALDEICALVNSRIGFYHFVEADQKTLSLQQWSTDTLKEFCRAADTEKHYDISRAGVWVECVAARKAVVHNDYAALANKKGLPEGHAKVIRELVVPIIRGGLVVAILGVGNKPTDYTDRDVETVSYLADVTWQMVDKKRTEEVLQASEALFRNLFEHHTAIKLLVDPDSRRIIDANLAAAEFYGWSQDQLRQMKISDIDTQLSDGPDQPADEFESKLKGNLEARHRLSNGSIRDVEILSSKIMVKGKTLFHSIIHDVTERKQAEAKLKTNYLLLRMAGETAKFGGWSVDLSNNRVIWSDEVAAIHGMPAGYSPMLDEGIAFYAPEWRSRITRVFNNCAENGIPYDEIMQIINADGKRIWIRASGEPVRDETGKIIRVEGSFQDISEQKLAEEALIESEGRYRNLMMHSPDAVFVSQLDCIILANYACQRLFGAKSIDELLGRSPFELFHPDCHNEIRSGLLQLQDDLDKPLPLREEKIVRVDGSVIDVEMNAATFTCGGGSAVHIILRDITGRKTAEADRTLLRSAIEQTGEMIVITDQNGIIQYVNPAFEKVTGYSRQEAVGQNPRLLKSGKQTGAFYQNLWETISSGRVFQARMINKRKDGTTFTEEATISPVRDPAGKIINYIAVKHDISEHLRLESQFQQAQKMESVGRLAGGVAHDFNNMLSVIIGNTELAMGKVPAGDTLHADLNEILVAAKRSTEITRQLLAFARKQTIQPRIIDLNETVEGMLKMLRRLIGEDITLVWEPDCHLKPVKVDPTQIEQVLANLCVNARDAITGVGRIGIQTKMITLEEKFCASHAGFHPGRFVLLTVSDNGCGMSKETLDCIFEPFFTTKGPNKGTGLGLATVFGMVKQNDGLVNVRSSPGKGTTFMIYFPCQEAKIEETRNDNLTRIPPNKGETILLVEDEPAIKDMGQRILNGLGYRVLAAGNPSEAMMLARENSDTIELLVTDVIMPEMNGRDLATHLLKICPDMRILFMSGYTADVIANRGILEEGVHFIQKPFSLKGLGIKVREILDAEKKNQLPP